MRRCLLAMIFLWGCSSPEPDSWTDPWCIDGHEPATPVLRVRAMIVDRPLSLSDPATRDQIQLLIDSEDILYLYLFEPDAHGEPTLSMGSAEQVDALTYRLLPGSGMEAAPLVVSGESFHTREGSVDLMMVHVSMSLGSFPLPLRDVTVEGDFNTSERCSIGELEQEGTPDAASQWQSTARMRGKITVREALATPVSLGPIESTLCAWLAGEAFGPGCGNPSDTWFFPPDTELDGEPAWHVDITHAGTAVHLLR